MLLIFPSPFLHNAQLSETFENLLIHTAEPFFLEGLFSSYLLYSLLKMLSDKCNKVNLMDGVSINEFALAYILRCFGFCRVIRFWRPEQRAGMKNQCLQSWQKLTQGNTYS